MRRAIILPAARRDLEDTLEHLIDVSDNFPTARRFVSRLRQKCHEIASLPGTLGVARPDLRPDVRSVVYGSYVIIFRYVGDRFEVVRVIEGHRDLPAQLR